MRKHLPIIILSIFTIQLLSAKSGDSLSIDSVQFEVHFDSLAYNTDDSVAAQNVFAIWETEKIDPYKIDVVKKMDTTLIVMCPDTCQKHYVHPVIDKRVNSDFGYRRYRYHYGIDLELNTGDPVYSCFSGTVRFAQYEGGYGKCVLITHYNGLETLYAHLSQIWVGVGDSVGPGKQIGLGGATGRTTGSHLHFEVRFMGQPMDPNKIIDFEHKKLKADSLLLCKETFDYLIELRKVKYHTVRSGDSLWRISRLYGTPVNTLCRLNHINRNAVLQIGQRIRYQ